MDSGGSWRAKRNGNGATGVPTPPSFRGGRGGGATRPNGDGRASNSRQATQQRNHNNMGGHQERLRIAEPPPVVLMAMEEPQHHQGRSAPPRAAEFIPGQESQKLNGPLLILDINGVLLRRDGYEKGKQRKYKMRPYAYEFLDWAFQNFTCGVWSCGKRETLELEVFDRYRSKLVFVRSQDDSTNLWPRRSHVAQEKPLFLKELGRLWKQDPRFHANNTILLDNHAEKFERNPIGTCLLVPDYEGDSADKVLDLEGELVKHLREMRRTISLAEYAQGNIDSYYFSYLKNPPSPESLPGRDPTNLRRTLATLFTSSTVMKTLCPDRDVDFYMNHRDTPGPRAATFSRRDIKRLSRTAKDWLACEKTDGTRFLFFIPPRDSDVTIEEKADPIGYFVDRSWTFTPAMLSETSVFARQNSGVLLDGEMVTEGLSQPMFLIFDVVFLFGEDVGAFPTLQRRLAKLRDQAPNLENETFQFGTAMEARFAIKHFLPLWQLGKINPRKAVFPFGEVACDGLVFTPSNSYYQTTVLKFKPSDRLTVDFLLAGTTSDWGERAETAPLRLNAVIKGAGSGGAKPHYSDFNIVGELILDGPTRSKLKQFEQSRREGTARSFHGRGHASSFARIVECSFDRAEGAWRLVGIRGDKLQPNSLSTAWKVLESVAESLTYEELVEAFSSSSEIAYPDSDEDPRAHYDARQKHREENGALDARIAVLRRMNNLVKSELIGSSGFETEPLFQDHDAPCPLPSDVAVSSFRTSNKSRNRKPYSSQRKLTSASVLEIACGRGGDLLKWFKQYDIQLYVGTDVSPVALAEAHRRAEESKLTASKSIFFVADAGDDVFPDQLRTELERAGKSKDTTFDLVSVQFALHYFCASREACARFFSHIRAFSRPGTKILVTMLDPGVVNAKLEEHDGKFEIDICKIELRQASTSVDDFSRTIVFSLGDAVVDLPEPLVNFAALLEVAEQSGFALTKKLNLSAILAHACKAGANPGIPIEDRAVNLRSEILSVLGSCNRGISESEWKVLQLYCALVFECK